MTSRRPGSMYLVLLLLTSALFVSVSSIMIPTIVHAAATITSISPTSDSPTPPGQSDIRKTITVTGSGFVAADAGTCTISGTVSGGTLYVDLTSCYISSTGTFTGYFRVGLGSSAQAYVLTVHATATVSTATSALTFTVTPRIGLSPTSGAATTAVTVVGAGFSSISSAICEVTGTTVQTPITSCSQGTDGVLIAVFTVKSTSPPLPSGTYLVTAKDGTGGAGCSSSLCSATAAFTIIGGPILTLTPPFATTDTTVTVTGSGWNPADTYVDLYESPTTPPDGSSDLWGVPTKRRCNVDPATHNIVTAPACQFTVKSNAPGKLPFYTVWGIGQFGDYSKAEFLVLSKFELTPETGGKGILVILSGSGFIAGTGACTPTLIPASPLLYAGSTGCSVDTFGILTGSFIVDTGASLITYTIRLTDPAKVVQGTVSDTFTVTGPSIWLSARSPGSGATGFTGTTVDVTGSGWSLSDTSVTLYEGVTTPDFSAALWGVPAIFTCPFVPGTGTIASGCKFTVKSNALGDIYDIYAQGTPYNEWAHAQFTVQSTFVLTPNSGGLGAAVAISGSGYLGLSADCKAKISSTGPDGANKLFDTGTVTSCTIDASGQLTGAFTVEKPDPILTPAPYGVHTVTISDVALVQQVSISVPFTVNSPTISLSPNHGAAGTAVTFTGASFSILDKSCQVFWGTSVTPITGSTCSVPAAGTVSGQFSVPALAVPSGYTVTVKGYITPTDPSGQPVLDSASATFTVEPSVTLAPTSGRPGTSVLVSGSSFAAGDAGSCTISSSPSNIISSPSCSISASGGLSGLFTVAVGAVGSATPYTVTVTGTTGDHGQASFTVPPPPTLTLDPITGPAGTPVTASGPNYAGTSCTLTSAPGGLFTSYSCALAAGTLTGSFTVSSGASPGTSYTVTATSNIGGTDSASATFAVTSGTVGTLTLTPTSGIPGTPVSGTGTGFATDTSCILSSAPSGLMSSPSCTILGGGNINVGFTVSSTAGPGSYTVLAVGNTGKSASGSFTVTAVTTTTTGASFTVSVTPSSLTLNPGGVGTISVIVQSLGSFNSPVVLSVPTFPSGVTGGFTPNPVTPPAGGPTSSVLSIAVSAAAPGSTTIITASGTGGGLTATVPVTLIVTSTTSTSTTITGSTVTTTGPWVPPKCIIATATFGSEASPAVQFLRNFRDHLVLGTKAGSAFMEVFNAWYYSFSPSVAKIIAANDPLRAPIRVILYPLLGVLGISTLTYSIFSETPEFAAVVAGLVASSLIGLVYLTPFAFVGMRALTRRRRIKVTNVAKGSLLLLAAALALLAAGELAGSFLLLAAGSSVLVLTCVIAVPAIAALAFIRPATQ